MPLPESDGNGAVVYGDEFQNDYTFHGDVWMEEKLRAAREQIAAEGDEVIGRLCEAVSRAVEILDAGYVIPSASSEHKALCAALAEARKV